jgi:NitT/TauT family transport system ATP-binding protein
MSKVDAEIRKEVNSNNNGEVLHGAHVSLVDLGVRFKSARGDEVEAVKDFTLDIEPEEFICIIGPSGCGKSTVLNVIAGFVDVSSGSAKIDGEEILEPSPERGVVFQDYALFPWLNVLENAGFGLKMQQVDKTLRSKIAKEKIDQVHLTGFEAKYPHELSGGMKQRVGIARILASNPRVMLMDEPFGALDAQTREMMQELLLEVWDQYRATVVFVTHDLDEAIFLSDKIVLMSARPGTVKEVYSNPLPRPRNIDVYTTKEFIDLKLRLTTSLREEIAASRELPG